MDAGVFRLPCIGGRLPFELRFSSFGERHWTASIGDQGQRPAISENRSSKLEDRRSKKSTINE
jgi:hypothetical protein